MGGDIVPPPNGFCGNPAGPLPVNILAVVWGIGMALNLAWPRAAVYGEGWYYEWGAFIYIGIILGAGLLWYAVKGRHHIGCLESHAATTKSEAILDG